MKLIERLRIQRDLRDHYREYRAEGLDHDEASEKMIGYAEEKYGALDWAEIIEIVMMILALFSKAPFSK